MSKKKHRIGAAVTEEHVSGLADIEEYRIIGRDLVRVLLLNAIYLVAILLVYYTNREHHYLEEFASRVFHW